MQAGGLTKCFSITLIGRVKGQMLAAMYASQLQKKGPSEAPVVAISRWPSLQWSNMLLYMAFWGHPGMPFRVGSEIALFVEPTLPTIKASG
jgi:hypothetical protein